MADEVAIFDTYVKRPSGTVMHFDIVVPKGTEPRVVYDFGKDYLNGKKVQLEHFSTKLCTFCHVEKPTPIMAQDISKKGYHIIEISDCD